MKKRIPHGQSNYKDLILDNFYYVDRTMYIEKLEQVPNKYQFLLRPRKFGKSLFVSMLQYYYGIEHKASFQDLFGEYYIGKKPTPLANTFYVLKVDFSGLRTDSSEIIYEELTKTVNIAVSGFLDRYKLFNENEERDILGNNSPNMLIRALLSKLANHESGIKVCILIDEYDHFTNELVSFNKPLFSEIVSQNGFFRKLFEAIKEGTGLGVVARLFATGVTPVTLDSMTSGFNIAKNISLDERFNEAMGFTEQEVAQMVEYFEIPDASKVLSDMRIYYNGSMFSKIGLHRLYNSNMVIYFLDSLIGLRRYPDSLMDLNIMSDYKKISNILELLDYAESQDKITEILKNGEILAELTLQFNFERPFTTDDLISLLYYNGLLTIKGVDFGNIVFSIPNYVIQELYWRFFAQRLEKQSELTVDTSQLHSAIKQMAIEGKIDLYMDIINNTMKQLSNRDLQNFDEKYVKMLFMAFASLSPIYYKKSEYEANKKYPDLLFLSTPVIPVENQMLFEFKYVKVSESHRLEEKIAEATAQIQGYLQLDEIKQIKNLHCYAVVFVGEVGAWRQVN